MTHFRFVHASDLHLDTPFQGVGRLDPEVGAALRDASLEAWDALVALTLERRANFLLLAGDIYDGADRGVRAQLRFLKGLERLAEAEIKVFVAYGNHDPLDGWSAIHRWPSNVTVFGHHRVESVNIERQGERLATVHGISYPRRDVTENLALRFARGPENGFQIGVLHCNVGSQPEHPTYSPCTIDDLRRIGLDYWALGHIHKRQTLLEGRPWIAYSGNLQGRSLKPSERGAKGALVVDVEGEVVTRMEFVACDRVRPVVVELDIGGLRDIPDLSVALLERAAHARTEHEGRALLVRGVLGGTGALHEELQRSARLKELLISLRDEAKAESPFIWWEGLVDESRPALDIPSIVARGDFSAELVQAAEELRNDRAQLLELMDRQFKPLQRTRVNKWVPSSDRGEEQLLVARSEALALDALERTLSE